MSYIRGAGLTSQKGHSCDHLAEEYIQRMEAPLSSGHTDTLTRHRHELSVLGTQGATKEELVRAQVPRKEKVLSWVRAFGSRLSKQETGGKLGSEVGLG